MKVPSSRQSKTDERDYVNDGVTSRSKPATRDVWSQPSDRARSSQRSKLPSLWGMAKSLATGLVLSAPKAYGASVVCPPTYSPQLVDWNYAHQIQVQRPPDGFFGPIVFSRKNCAESFAELTDHRLLHQVNLECKAIGAGLANDVAYGSFAVCGEPSYFAECSYDEDNLYPTYRMLRYFCTPQS